MIGGKVSPKFGFKKFADFQKSVNAAADKAAAFGALEIRNEAILLIRDNTDGTRARRYNPSREVNVSFPGDPPNTDTGRLIQSIKFEKVERGRYLVGTNLAYGKYLEFGTQEMKARPWLSVAIVNSTEKILKVFDDSYKGVIRSFK